MNSKSHEAVYELEILAEDIALSANELSGALDENDQDEVAYRMSEIDKAIAKIDTIRANVFLQLITHNHINMETYVESQYNDDSDDDDCCTDITEEGDK
jgi:hypothetical protein